ncbi:MAG: hypothetical protein FJ146_03765 [Deltaproteobacteria bacterium]|nr:hypothetical protein [Deltaproteobacteria bacterium]
MLHRLQLYLVLVVMMLSSAARAQEADFDLPFLMSEEPETDESAEARQSTKYHIGVELYSGSNLSLGYQLSRDLSVELYTESPPQSTSVNIGPHPCELINGPYIDDGFIRGGRIRWFLTNDFNVAFSPYYRKYETTCTASDGVSKYSPGDKTSYGLSASVGSRWQWRHFYAGAEWLGLGLERGDPKWRDGRFKSDPYSRLIYLRLVLGASI